MFVCNNVWVENHSVMKCFKSGCVLFIYIACLMLSYNNSTFTFHRYSEDLIYLLGHRPKKRLNISPDGGFEWIWFVKDNSRATYYVTKSTEVLSDRLDQRV